LIIHILIQLVNKQPSRHQIFTFGPKSFVRAIRQDVDTKGLPHLLPQRLNLRTIVENNFVWLLALIERLVRIPEKKFHSFCDKRVRMRFRPVPKGQTSKQTKNTRSSAIQHNLTFQNTKTTQDIFLCGGIVPKTMIRSTQTLDAKEKKKKKKKKKRQDTYFSGPRFSTTLISFNFSYFTAIGQKRKTGKIAKKSKIIETPIKRVATRKDACIVLMFLLSCCIRLLGPFLVPAKKNVSWRRGVIIRV
jgi:hypothetical protein